MKIIESLKESRRNLLTKQNADLEKSLYVKPIFSERAKAQSGSLLTTAGGLLLGGAVVFRNEALLAAGLIVETGGLTVVSLVGSKADAAKRILRNRTREQAGPHTQ